jgi:protein O-mannosyl-transferase
MTRPLARNRGLNAGKGSRHCWQALGIVALFYAALILVYAPAMKGGFLWDDDTYIVNETALRTLSGLKSIWIDPSVTPQYYPLSSTVFWAIYQGFGLHTFPYHLVTLFFHGITAILLWQTLKRLEVKGALLAGILFAFHPLNVMSVAWVTELKNTLSCALALGAGWAYIRYAGLGSYRGRAGGRRWYGLALGLFLLAMLAKSAVGFLPITLGLVVWWKRDGMANRRDWLGLAPFIALAVGMDAFTVYIEQHGGGASGQEFQLGFPERVLVSGRSFWFYLGKLAWPSSLVFIYPRWTLNAGAWWQWLFPAGMVATLAGAWCARKRIGRGLFVGLMHYFLSTSMLVLVVVLYMMKYSFVADHWAYFGNLSLMSMVAWVIAAGSGKLGQDWAKPVEIGVSLSAASALAVLSWAQAASYRDAETLWRTTIAKNRECWVAYSNLGGVLFLKGDLAGAAAEIEEAIKLQPQDESSHFDLARVMSQGGRTDEAIAEYRNAVSIKPTDAEAHSALGVLLLRSGAGVEGMAELRRAVQLDAAYADGHASLGDAFLQQGRDEEAASQYEEALRLAPGTVATEYDLGLAFGRLGALEGCRRAIRKRADAATGERRS